MNADDKKLSKQELLEEIRVEHGLLEETLSRLTHAQMLIGGVEGEWCVKDILAHISTWERWMIRWTTSLVRGEKPDTPDPWDVDRMNEKTFARVKGLALADVLEEFRLSYWDSVTLAESLSEAQLHSISTKTWPMGPLWTGIAANTYWHYREHRADIEAWIKKSKQER